MPPASCISAVLSEIRLQGLMDTTDQKQAARTCILLYNPSHGSQAWQGIAAMEADTSNGRHMACTISCCGLWDQKRSCPVKGLLSAAQKTNLRVGIVHERCYFHCLRCGLIFANVLCQTTSCTERYSSNHTQKIACVQNTKPSRMTKQATADLHSAAGASAPPNPLP